MIEPPRRFVRMYDLIYLTGGLAAFAVFGAYLWLLRRV